MLLIIPLGLIIMVLLSQGDDVDIILKPTEDRDDG